MYNRWHVGIRLVHRVKEGSAKSDAAEDTRYEKSDGATVMYIRTTLRSE